MAQNGMGRTAPQRRACRVDAPLGGGKNLLESMLIFGGNHAYFRQRAARQQPDAGGRYNTALLETLLEFWKVEPSSVCAMEAGSRSALFARPTTKKCWRQLEEPASNRCSGASSCQSSTFRTRSSTSSYITSISRIMWLWSPNSTKTAAASSSEADATSWSNRAKRKWRLWSSTLIREKESGRY